MQYTALSAIALENSTLALQYNVFIHDVDNLLMTDGGME